jgi:hypothetical protein
MSKRRNLKKEKQERNRAYARKFKKRKLRTDGRPDGGTVPGPSTNGGAAESGISFIVIVWSSISYAYLRHNHGCKYCYTDLQ